MGEPQLYRERNDATEEGYTSTMRKNILGMEGKIRQNEDEGLYFYTPRGRLISFMQGKGGNVAKQEGFVIPQNAIMTHNHPSGLSQTGIKRIGNSFSRTDMITAVANNAKEMRAVTPTYTFSMKRPKGGWRATPQEVLDAYLDYEGKVRAELGSYVDRRGYSQTAQRRAEVLHWHKVNKLVADHFGWKYTKKNK